MLVVEGIVDVGFVGGASRAVEEDELRVARRGGGVGLGGIVGMWRW
jgi:hypothetical protein